MNMHTPSAYLSRNKARDFFGGYHAMSKPLRRKLTDLFDQFGEPRQILLNGFKALLFDRKPAEQHAILLKAEDHFGHLLVTPALEVVEVKEEYIEDVDKDWRPPT